MKRQVLKLISFYGIVATSYSQLQMDPPESTFLAQKCATISFINFSTMLESGLHDGICRTLMDDLHGKLLSNEYGHVMNHYVNLVSPQANPAQSVAGFSGG